MDPQGRRLPLLEVILGVIILFLASAPPARAQSGLLVYVPNQTTNNVRVFRTEAGGGLTPVATIPVGIQPKEAVVRADQAFAYVANNVGTISVISTKTQTVIQTIAAGAFPWGMAFNPDYTRLYVTNRNGDTVSVFSVAEGSGQLAPVTTFGSAGGPLAAAVTPDGTRLYVANTTGNVVRVFDTSTNALLTSIPVGTSPSDLVMNPAGTRVYVPNFASNSVSVIDTDSNTVLGSFATGTGPSAASVSPNGSYLYVTNATAGTISQFDAATLAPLAPDVSTSGTNAFGLALTPNGSVLYATNDENDLVALFSVGAGGALSGLGTQPVGLGNSSPFGVGVCANGNKLLTPGLSFVANTAAAIGCTADNPVFTGGTLLINADGLVFPQTFTFSSGGAIETAGNNAELSGLLTGAGGLTKQGAGTLTLSGVNTTLGGLSVVEGTLRVTGSVAVESAAAIEGGTTLEGTGRISTPVSVKSGATLSPGNPGSSVGTLTTGNLTLSSGSAVEISLNGPLAGTGYDVVAAQGSASLGGATLALSLGFTPAAGQVFTILDNDGADAVVGTFAGLAEAATFTAGGTTFHISYRGGNGNDVQLSVLPVTPTLTGIASPSVNLGGAINDTGILNFGASPTGTITFRLYGPNDATCGGSPVFTSVSTVVQNGPYQSGSFVPSSAGVYRWIASYSGDTNNNAIATACEDPGQVVTVGGSGNTAQTITFDALPPRTFGDPPFTVTASASSGLPVSFSAATPSVCSVSGNTVSIVAAGVCTIAADQGGDSTYSAAPTVTQSFAVAKAGQTIAFGALPARTLAESPFTVSATSTSNLAVTFSSQTPGICSVSGNTVTLLAAGTCTIAADQAGDGNYDAAAQVTRSFTVGAACALSPAQLPLGLERIPYSATVTLANAAGALTLTGSLPPGLTFSNGVVSGTPTARGAFSFTISGTDSTGCQASTAYSLAVSAERRLAVSAGAGGAAIVRAFNVASATPRLDVNAFAGFGGGASVAQADVDGNGVADVIVGAGAGGSSTVAVLSEGTPGLSFNAFPASFGGGVEVAAGDVTGDGTPEILVAAGCGGPGGVRAFNGRTGALVRDFAIAAPFATCGLHLAAGDVNADGTADIVVGTGEMGSPFVQVINGATGAVIRDLVSFDASFAGGVYVAAGDVNGDGFADVIAGAAAGGLPRVRVFDGVTGAQLGGTLGSFLAYTLGFNGGVRVAAGDLNGDGHSEVITGAGPGGAPHVRVWDGASGTEIYGLYALDPSFPGGTFVAGPPATGRMAIDIAAVRTTGTQVRIAGWALREIAANTVGTDAIHVWALPADGAAPVFVGAADNRVARPDVAAAFGGEFLMSGFDFTGTLASGTYDLIVFVRNSRTLRFDQSRVVRVTVN